VGRTKDDLRPIYAHWEDLKPKTFFEPRSRPI